MDDKPLADSAALEEMVRQKSLELRRAIEALTAVTGGPFTPWAPHLSEQQLTNCRVLPSRYHLLQQMPKHAICVEVGTQTGNFSREIISKTQPAELHLIDLDLTQLERSGLKEQIESGVIRLHEGRSWAVLSSFPDSYFDWIYIDADHSYEGVSRDLDAAKKKLKSGGLLACNDYTVWSPGEVSPYGVLKAVHELCSAENWEFVFVALHGQGYHDVCIRRASSSHRVQAETPMPNT